jgi:hypothetical protein
MHVKVSKFPLLCHAHSPTSVALTFPAHACYDHDHAAHLSKAIHINYAGCCQVTVGPGMTGRYSTVHALPRRHRLLHAVLKVNMYESIAYNLVSSADLLS